MTKFAHAPARSATRFCSWCGPYALAAVEASTMTRPMIPACK